MIAQPRPSPAPFSSSTAPSSHLVLRQDSFAAVPCSPSAFAYMSSDSLRVELPAYSHSFQVNAPPQSTIRDVKQEIARVCPGSPSPEGQRLVFKGRFLNDDQKVEDVWKVRSTCSSSGYDTV